MNHELIRKMDREHVIYPWKAQRTNKPIIIDHADGIYMWDTSGKRYIDFCAGLLCINLGHGNRYVIEAMTKQMDKLCYVASNFATEPKARLAAMIADLTPGDLDYVFFTTGGAEAVENAIKAARMATGRNKIYSAWRSYHGATAGAISISGDPRRWAAEPGIPGTEKFFGPYCYHCPLGYPSQDDCKLQCLETLKTQLMFDNPKSVAAIFLEPIVGTSGIIIPPTEFVKGVRQICDENGILLVADEVMSAWGRSGKWFAMEHYQVTPDILVTAKGLTSAYIQLGAMIWSKKVWDYFYDHPFVGGLTYEGHALACAAGIANIEVYKNEHLIEQSATNGEYLRQQLEVMMAAHPSVGDVRCKGLWACIELTSNKATRAPLAGFVNSRRDVMTSLTKILYDQGLYLFAKWDYIFISPPLIITREQLDEALAIIDQALVYADSLLS